MATTDTITKVLTELQHLPNCPMNDTNIGRIVEQYTLDLGDIPDEILGAATIHYRTGSNQFFPTSGQLREKATELLLLAMNIPTAGQAWAQVIAAVRMGDSVWCKEGERLFHGADNKTGGEYWDAIFAYRAHMEKCETCERGGYREVYEHPVVEKIVFEMGGRDRLLDGDISVCRSLFIRGYNEQVQRHVKLATMARPVRETVNRITGAQMQQLADGMAK